MEQKRNLQHTSIQVRRQKILTTWTLLLWFGPAMVITKAALSLPPNDYTIVPGKRAGNCIIGGDPDVVAPEWGPPRKRTAPKPKPESIPAVYYEYPEWGIWMLIQNYRIVKIGIEAEGWHTREGISVHSPVQLVHRYFGPGKVKPVPGSSKDVRYFLEYPHRGISFLIRTLTHRVDAIHIYQPIRNPNGDKQPGR